MFGLLLPLAMMAALQKKPGPSIPSLPDVTSPETTQALAASRRRLAQMGGRQSTLLTGGLFGAPSLLSQGLTA